MTRWLLPLYSSSIPLPTSGPKTIDFITPFAFSDNRKPFTLNRNIVLCSQFNSVELPSNSIVIFSTCPTLLRRPSSGSVPFTLHSNELLLEIISWYYFKFTYLLSKYFRQSPSDSYSSSLFVIFNHIDSIVPLQEKTRVDVSTQLKISLLSFD